jgi:hypothetical protein
VPLDALAQRVITVQFGEPVHTALCAKAASICALAVAMTAVLSGSAPRFLALGE